MRFEELYERYRTGAATAEEAARVEEELAKFRLLTDHVAQHDELDLPEPPTEAEAREYRAVERRARRSTARYSLASASVGGSGRSSSSCWATWSVSNRNLASSSSTRAASSAVAAPVRYLS